MHNRNIVDRDLKLENLLYERKDGKFDEKESSIKIIDFGTSRLVSPDVALHAKMGSPFYVAPEVLNRNYNIKCDVWSCGVIMYILLGGSPPFNGPSTEKIFELIKEAPLEFECNVHKMQKIPGRRFRPKLSISLRACSIATSKDDPTPKLF